MKKSLLSILALAVFATGCQNYDDQFDSLNKQITALTSKVDNLNPATAADISAITGQLTTLKGLVDAMTAQNATDLASALAKIAEITAALEALDTKVASDIAGVETSVASVTAALADTASEADVAALQSVTNLQTELDAIKAALDGLLSAGASLKRDIVISSSAELNLAESLIDATSTADYIIEGNVHIDLTTAANYGGTASLTAAVARVSALTAKIATVLGSVTATTVSTSAALNMDKLTYVKEGLNIAGKMPTVSALATTGSLTLDTDDGTYSLPTLVSAGPIVIDISTAVSVTSIQFANVASTDDAITGAGVFTAVDAEVNLGTAGLPAAVTVASLIGGGSSHAGTISTTVGGVTLSATTVSGSTILSKGDISLTGTTALSSVTLISAGNITSAAASMTGVATITGGTGATISLAATSLETATITTSGGTVNLASLIDHGAVNAADDPVLAIYATTVDLSGMTSNSTALMVSNVTTLSMPSLAVATASITGAGVTTFSAPKLTLNASKTIDFAAGLTLTVGAIDGTAVAGLGGSGALLGAGQTLMASDVLNLTVVEQDVDLDLNIGGEWPALKTLTITGKEGTDPSAQNNDVTVGSANVTLTTITMTSGSVLSSFSSLGGVATSITTNGKIRGFTVSGTTLTSLAFGHAHVSPGAASTIDVQNTKIAALDMAQDIKTGTILVTGNASLTSITMPTTNILVEPTANVSVTIYGNNLPGVYTAAVSGTDVTSYTAADFTDGTVGLTGANTWISTISSQTGRTGTVLFNIEIDAATASMTANKDIAIELAGQANAAAEYNIRPTASGNANKVADLISGTVAIIDTFLELGMLDD